MHLQFLWQLGRESLTDGLPGSSRPRGELASRVANDTGSVFAISRFLWSVSDRAFSYTY